jgi:glycosyltransferase involved in cell wall biosynthesis
MKNLIGEFADRGLDIDLLRIRNHGPELDRVPGNVRLIDLGTAHVNSSLPVLVKYLRRERPQALLVDKDRLNRVALWARRLAGVKTRVAVRIGTTVSENLQRRGWFDRNLQYFSFRHFYPMADAIIVPSLGAADDLASVARLPVERITVVPSPVVNADLLAKAKEDPGHPWFKPGQPPVLLGIGELCARKDFVTLIRAFALVRKQTLLRLLILGEGRQRQMLEGLVAELGLEQEVMLPGFVANPYAYIARAGLFALTSRCEGAPVVLMEALGIGCPVVSTDCPSGPREIMQNGRYGKLVPIGDEQGLASVILETLAQPLPAEVLRQAAEPYTVAFSADRYLSALGMKP